MATFVKDQFLLCFETMSTVLCSCWPNASHHMNRCIGKWKEANDSYKDHLEGQLILQFGVIVEPFYSEQIVEFDRC